jgi:photosynthetic reaction center cytochrome c subunit
MLRSDRTFAHAGMPVLAAALLLAVSMTGAVAYGQAPGATESKALMSEQFFKNIQVLKGIPVNEFMATMGFFSASLGYSCENCHDGNTWENYISDAPAKKRRARGMVAMVNTINKNFFAGRQVVTCYSCHHGVNQPRITPDLTALYSSPAEEPTDIVNTAAAGPTADQIFAQYAQAIGGAQKLATLTSYVAKGTSAGYGLGVDKDPTEIYAKATGERATIVHGATGVSSNSYDGREAWMAGPQIAGPNLEVPPLSLVEEDLEGARVDGLLFFPGRAKQALAQWKAGTPTEIDDNDVQVVQGISAAGEIVTLYFDAETHLLTRSVRYTNSPVGRIPTRVDYSDYREVAGVKMPFKWTATWLDGRQTFELTDVQPNTAIDAAKFGKPPTR